MATISENLQTIKSSMGAIKQAISDRGGDVSGDISTWAGAIGAISENDSDEKITFTGTVTRENLTLHISGILNKTFDMTKCIVILTYSDAMVVKYTSLDVETSSVEISVNLGAPVNGIPLFSMVITNYDGSDAKVVDLILL